MRQFGERRDRIAA